MHLTLSTDHSSANNYLVLATEHGTVVECSVPSEIKTEIAHYIQHSSFKAIGGEMAFLVLPSGKSLVICGIGKSDNLSSDAVRKAIGKGLKELRRQGKSEVSIFSHEQVVEDFGLEQWCQWVGETSHLALYEYRRFLSPANQSLDTVSVICDTVTEQATEALERGEILGKSTLIARNLINEPAADLYPEKLASEVIKLGETYGFEVDVFDEAQCRELGMHAFLAVGEAAEKRSRLIVMRWKGGEGEPIGLIGKGVTYDTGGLSLKPTGSMLHMKSDMSGSAIAIGTMCALAQLKSSKNVIAIVAACENSMGPKSFRPGDVLRSMNGKTIEIKNTDAEGRLTLADAICYAIRKEKVSSIIDIATLTGAVKVALGDHIAGAVTNLDDLYAALGVASSKADEKFWRLPIDDQYRDLNSSEIADIANTGRDGLAGTITAAAFVEAFTEDLPWLHLDVAGISFLRKDHEYISKGGTGRGVRTLYHLINAL